MFVTYHNFDVSMTPLVLGTPLVGGICHFSSAEAMGSIGSQAAQSVTATMSTANGQGTYMNADMHHPLTSRAVMRPRSVWTVLQCLSALLSLGGRL